MATGENFSGKPHPIQKQIKHGYVPLLPAFSLWCAV